MLVCGGREAEAGTVGVRHRTGDDVGAVPLDRVVTDLRREIDSRDASLTVGRS
jgi:threonyl-tRNA synthetase